jgi:hypothetical protein
MLKETTKANERWWKGPEMVALTSTEIVPYWFLLAQRPKQLSDPGLDFRQIGRWGGSSIVNEGMGVNNPSVKAPKRDHGWGNLRHTQSCREKGKRGSVGRGGESAYNRDRGRELEKNLET